MSIEAAIHSILAVDTTVSGLVATRIYPIGIPQAESRAAVVYQQIDGRQDLLCDGLTGLDEDTYQFSAWTIAGPTARQAAALTLIRAVRSAFFPGGVPYAGTVGGVTVKGVQIVGGMRDAPFIGSNENERRYGKQIDLQFSTTT